MKHSATRSMWAERGAHVGALVGGILSVTLGWIPLFIGDLAKEAWKNLAAVLFWGTAITVAVWGYMKINASDKYDAASVTSERFIYEFSQPDRACIRDWVPRIIANSHAPVTNKDLDGYITTCDKNNAMFRAVNKQKLELQEQMKFINKGKP